MIMTILLHTPAWVWLVLALLTALGARQARTHVLSPARVAVLPVLVIALSLVGVVRGYAVPAVAVVSWCAGFGAMIYLAGRRLAARGAHLEAATGRYVVPGSILPLLVLLTLFTAKYVSGVAVAMNPALAASAGFVATLSTVYGACSAVFYARARSLRALSRPAGTVVAA